MWSVQDYQMQFRQIKTCSPHYRLSNLSCNSRDLLLLLFIILDKNFWSGMDGVTKTQSLCSIKKDKLSSQEHGKNLKLLLHLLNWLLFVFEYYLNVILVLRCQHFFMDVIILYVSWHFVRFCLPNNHSWWLVLYIFNSCDCVQLFI